MTTYFTSDLHLGHENIIRFNNRPFSDVTEMNETLINNINEVVEEKDELYILGDFSFKMSVFHAMEYRKKINCKHVHLIYGNHDKDYDGRNCFESENYYKELKTEYGKIILFHYPILSWNGRRYGSIHLHGHIHSHGEYNEENQRKLVSEVSNDHPSKNDKLNYRIYDVGVDANNYRPVSLEYIVEFFGISKVK